MIHQLGPYFALFLALAAVLANIGVWAPRKFWVRCSAIVVAALFIPAAYASLSDLLSRPKPVSLEWMHRNAPEAAVLSAQIREKKGIYLWLQFPGAPEPRAYVLPYDLETAKRLYQAQAKAKQNGTRARMKHPFKQSLDTSINRFYAPPQPPRPVKRSTGSAPITIPYSGTSG